MRQKPNQAFTLVELLVVIAIIGVLVALLLPAVQAAREAARRLSCTNNLTQISIAVQGYEAAFRFYPIGTIDESGPIVNVAQGYHHNWLASLLPYLEEQNTYRHIDFSVGIYDEKNKPVREVVIPMFACPSDPRTYGQQPPSSYAGSHHDLNEPIDENNHGVFFLNSNVDYEAVSDGTSQTIFVGEKFIDPQGDLGWMSGTRATLRNTGVAINAVRPAGWRGQPSEPAKDDDPLAVGGFGSYHPGGANFAFGDGHVGFLAETTDPETYQQLGHRSDGKLLPRK